MTFGITSISVGVGALYPKFTFDHAAEIPTSFGGAICMIVSIAFIGVAVMIEAWPIYLLTMRGLNPGRSTVPVVGRYHLSGVCFIAIIASDAIRLGLKLGRLKDSFRAKTQARPSDGCLSTVIPAANECGDLKISPCGRNDGWIFGALAR
jgi:hypothetical protein